MPMTAPPASSTSSVRCAAGRGRSWSSVGSGPLTRHLLAAGHRVVASDASPAMLDLARRHLPDGQDIRLIVLPDDPLPAVDAVVSVGHVLSYLPDEEAIHGRWSRPQRPSGPAGAGGRPVRPRLRAGAARGATGGAPDGRLADRHRVLAALGREVRAGHHDLPPQPRRHVAARRRAPRTS